MRSCDSTWRLRRSGTDDLDGLYALAHEPLVFRYLFDGVVPDRTYLASRVAQAVTHASSSGMGMWLLENDTDRYGGCVELRPYPAPRSAELTYLLRPAYWGQGLATRMARTAITLAFLSSHIDAVIAGADAPNAASFALMRRLGMRFHQDVHYPLGAGREYILRRDDAGPAPRLPLLPILPTPEGGEDRG